MKSTTATAVLLGAALVAGGAPALAVPPVLPPPASARGAAAAAIHATWSQGAQVRVGRRVAVQGSVTDARGVVRLERRVRGTWRAVTTATVRADRTWNAALTSPSTPSAQAYRAVWLVRGRPAATGVLPTLEVYRLMTYSVTTRGKVTSDVAAFAAAAGRTYADRRGWRRAHLRFERVRRGGDFVLVLAQAKTLPSFSSTCSVKYSCRVGRYVVVNETPWLRKTPAFTGDLATYRHMVVNHETGHRLGLGHARCSGRGEAAPVMQQQSKGLAGCRFNAWPLAAEVAKVG